MATQKMNLGIWYGGGVRIPTNFETTRYRMFATSTLGIVRSLLNKTLGQRVKVKFKNTSTAYADQGNSHIVISTSYLFGDFGKGNLLSPSETLEILMGVVLHETAHFAFSPALLSEWADYIEMHTNYPQHFNAKLAGILGNITEDIFIEAECDRRLPNLSWTLQRLNEQLFDLPVLEKTLSEVQEIDEPPNTFAGVLALSNLALLAKTYKSIDNYYATDYVQEIFHLALSAGELQTIEERFALTTALYDRLVQGVGTKPVEQPKQRKSRQEVSEEEDGEGGADSGDEDEDDSDGESEAAEEQEEEEEEEQEEGEDEEEEEESEEEEDEDDEPFDLDSALDTLAEAAEGLISQEEGEVKNPQSEQQYQAEDIIDCMEKFETSSFRPVSEEGSAMNEDVLYIETPYELDPKLGGSLEMDKRYERLSELARQRAVVNRPYGLDEKRGHTIRRLHRIAIDGRIFAEPVLMNNYKPMQIMILVDCSGSMISGFPSKISRAFKAALGAAHALVEAHCEVAIYGHTAGTMGGKDVQIYRFKEFQESIVSLAPRLAGFLKDGKTGNNRDGCAIQYVSEKFTSSTRRRLLIVISDGAPWSLDYQGPQAIEHSNQVVNKLRSQRIDVLSISIEKDAIEANNEIYGADHNVFNEDPNVIERIVQSLLVA